MLAKIVGAKDAKTNKEIETFNKAIPGLSESHSGKHVQVVDMSSIQAKGLIQDGIHPNDDSYKFMAQQWHDGIKGAVARGWIKDPIGPDPKPSKGSYKDCLTKRSDPGTSPGNGPVSCGDLAVPSATSGKPTASAGGAVKPSGGHPAEPSNPAPEHAGSTTKASASAPKPVGHPPEPSNPSKPHSGSTSKASNPASKQSNPASPHGPKQSDSPSGAGPEQHEAGSVSTIKHSTTLPGGKVSVVTTSTTVAPPPGAAAPKPSSPGPKASSPSAKKSGSPSGAGSKQPEANSVSVIKHSTTFPGGKISVMTTSSTIAHPPGAAVPQKSSPVPKASSPAPKPSGTPSAAGAKQTPHPTSGPKPSKSSSIASSSSAHTEEVFIDPSIWKSKNPGIYCVPPCMFILPPLTLTKPTTITFPPLTTSLEVVHKTTKVVTSNGKKSTSTGYDRSTQTTTITIPPVTTDKIDFWNVVVTSGGKPTIHPTSSILPPPFVITNDRKSGEPIVTRTITPRPFPYDTSSSSIPTFPPPISFTNKGDDDHGGDKPGNKKGGPPCLLPTGCGHKCGEGLPGPLGIFAKAVLCNKPCLTDCLPHPHPDFIDPSDPDPPELPPIPGLPPAPNPKQPDPPPGPGPEKPDPKKPDLKPDPKKPNPPPDKRPSRPSPTSEKSKSCTTKTVTDYWVDCTTVSSKTTSCKTTSSSVVRGCTITATTHTTGGGSCPLITLNPDEDQGEDGTATKSNKPKSSSKAGGNGPTKTSKSSAKPPATKAPPPPKSSPKPSPTTSKPPPATQAPPSGLMLPKPPAKKGKEHKPDGVYFVMGYFIEGYVGGDVGGIGFNLDQGTARPAVFDYTNSKFTFDAYKNNGDDALWKDKKGIKNTHDQHFPVWPIRIGPFKGEGREGCKYYRGGLVNPGTLKCDKGGEFKCNQRSDKDNANVYCDRKKTWWFTPMVNCIQEHVPDELGEIVQDKNDKPPDKRGGLPGGRGPKPTGPGTS
ncbi:MAG: hypothetical protein Q9181_000706 [Wetmoreana brouardii]